MLLAMCFRISDYPGRILNRVIMKTTTFHKRKWACLLMGLQLPTAFDHIYNWQGDLVLDFAWFSVYKIIVTQQSLLY